MLVSQHLSAAKRIPNYLPIADRERHAHFCWASQHSARYTRVMEKRLKRYRWVSAAGVVLAGVTFLDTQVAAQVLRIGEMNTRQIQALDLSKTVVLVPGGILEEHGPYLPSYTDGYADDAYTRELAKAIVARPGWTVVVFPQIPLGNDPANTIGGKTVFPESYPVRVLQSTHDGARFFGEVASLMSPFPRG